MSKEKLMEENIIALIDDDNAARISIGQMLRLRNYKVEIFSSAEAGLMCPILPDVDCILCDIKMPGMSGVNFLSEVKRLNFLPPIIMITGHGDVSLAVQCIKSGAYDFIEKPFDDEVLLASVARCIEISALRRESKELRRRLKMLQPEEDGRFGMTGRGKNMQDLYEQIEVVAKSDSSVLIKGETGVGKEMVAQAIHTQSLRSSGPFIAVNAGALSETMLESELFGHIRGAFTGAERVREGKLVAASGGTLLLDEIESIPISAQIKLLRVLEDGLVYPLGKDTPKKIDIRLLVTTKENLKDCVKQRQMREDFYHRIMVLSIIVPSLRERKEDIPLLISYFLKHAANRNGIPIPKIPEKMVMAMMQHSWPGNIRELKHAVERMVITSSKGITGNFCSDNSFDTSRLISLPVTPGRLRDELEYTERYVIEVCLRENNGEINATSLALGISRRALYERMKKYELMKENFKT